MSSNRSIKEIMLSEKSLLIFSFLIITISYLPPVILGENISYRINDILDSNIVWVKMVLEFGGIFSSPDLIIPQMMGGIPLSGVFGSYDFSFVLFKLFGSFGGYVVSKYLMALIGFTGMYCLLKKYLIKDSYLYYIPVLVGLSFGLLPFWGFSSTVAGLPLAMYALLNLRQKENNISNWIILAFFAFYSSLILTGIFLLIVFSLVWLIDVFKRKSINWCLFGGLAFLSIMYIISHLPLFSSFFIDPDFESVRKSFIGIPISAKKIIDTVIQYTVFNDNNPWPFIVSLQRYIILPISLFALILLIKNKERNRLFISLILFIVVCSIFIAFYEWGRLAFIRDALTRIIPINFRRIYWLTSVCWYVIFSMSLVVIIKHLKKYGQVISIIALILQLLIVLNFQEYRLYRDDVPFNKFYAEHQFSDIKGFIARDTRTYKVISVGLHPSISQYNGFYTLDGYSINYPLSYKYEFRKIIEKELDKNKITGMFYDNWGGWCYAFSGEQDVSQLQFYVNNYPKINHLDFNYKVLKEMGGEYIISAAEIDMDNNKELELLKIFENYSDSHWTIYLYRVL